MTGVDFMMWVGSRAWRWTVSLPRASNVLVIGRHPAGCDETRMNIYLACTVRGNRGGVGAARAVAGLLESRGHTVMTAHLLADDVDAAESALSAQEVFERDVAWLDGSDLLIAEASGSSYGVGFEVGYVLGRAAHTGQRVLLLYDKARTQYVSRLIAGNAHPACATHGYHDADDMLRFIDAHVPVAGT
jgi:2'-deoxynucleoside 5'-phosphate N-hydrolase